MPADTPPPVRLLSEHVCNKIAAGEVIERPASVFKELVENSVDAGAGSIGVDVLQGGRKAVIVTDDGSGMDKENALLSLERHATSKIRDVDDIEHIHTMGFRGEALAAIAAVSRFELTTRRPEDLSGHRLNVEAGTLRDVVETGCPPGTRIEVRNLFFNVPARRKFLRTEATELANIRTLFHTFAIAHPEVTLRLKVDGRELEHYPSQSRLEDRIADVYGGGLLKDLREVELQQGDLHIHGFVGIPTLHRGDRRDQITLVNRRPATAPVLGFAIREAYQDTLPKNRHAVAFLHLDMPADWVDVNVHPTKREVRFGPSHRIRDALIGAITEALSPSSGAISPEPDEPREDLTPKPPLLSPEKRQPDLEVSPPHYPPLPPASLPPERSEALAQAPASPPPPSTRREPDPDPDSPWKDAQFLGTVQNRFCLLETSDGLVILDPASARERILFERTKRELERSGVHSQPLLVPETVQVDPLTTRKLDEHHELLESLGFRIEPFGGDTLLVEALPAWMGDVDPSETLEMLAEELGQHTGSRHTPEKLREQLARSCCRMATRKLPAPTREEVRLLMKELGACAMPYTTPYGRPTLIHMGIGELRRKFGLDA